MFVGATAIGSVDAVFAEGDAALAEYLAVRWDSRGGEPVLVATRDVQSIDDRGVVLMGDDVEQYAALATFTPGSRPNLRRLH